MSIESVCARDILGFGREASGRFHDVIGSNMAPFNAARRHLSENLNGVSIDNESSLVCLDTALEAAVNRVKLEQINLKNDIRSDKARPILILTIWSSFMNGLDEICEKHHCEDEGDILVDSHNF